jgi:S-formylglutathione hydrolase FrmB
MLTPPIDRQETPKVTIHDLTCESAVLRGNPMKDPTLRHVAVFRPAGTEGRRLPLVLYLPGFGGSSDDALANPHPWTEIVAYLHAQGVDVVFAIVDGRNRFGCSQYVNSPASGKYLDYLCDEVVPQVCRREGCGATFRDRLVVGHSSGGFGALRLGMARQNLFSGVVALSPDAYFEVTQLPDTHTDQVAKVPFEKIEELQPPTLASPAGLGGDVVYALALCADYVGNSDGTFDWFYDKAGHYRQDVYQRALTADPVQVAMHSSRPFSHAQRVYLDGAAQDDFKANLGAQRVGEVLAKKGVDYTTYYPPGHHSDHLRERIVRGIDWIFKKPLESISG